MTLRITLAPARKNRGRVVSGGVAFDEGVALVATLSPHSRRFFELIGATVEEVVDDGDAPRPLADLGRNELVAWADAQIPPIEVKRSGSKDDVLETITTELDRRVAEQQEAATRAAAEQFHDATTVTITSADQPGHSPATLTDPAPEAGEDGDEDQQAGTGEE